MSAPQLDLILLNEIRQKIEVIDNQYNIKFMDQQRQIDFEKKTLTLQLDSLKSKKSIRNASNQEIKSKIQEILKKQQQTLFEIDTSENLLADLKNEYLQQQNRNLKTNIYKQDNSQIGFNPTEFYAGDHQDNDQTGNIYLRPIDKQTNCFKIMSQCSENNTNYIDASFPQKIQSIDPDKNNEDYLIFKAAKWLRPDQIFKKQYHEIKLFDQIQPEDIKQGLLQNSYLLATMSAIAKFPNIVEKIFINKEANPFGVYSVIMYKLGVPNEITVDDYFPCKDLKGDLLFCKPNVPQIWVLILEKAFSKFMGNYALVEGGLPHIVLEQITGYPSKTYNKSHAVYKDIQQMGKLLQENDKNNNLMTAVLAAKGESRSEKGIVAGHAYTIISVYLIDSRIYLLKLRNPWGYFEYQGQYNNESKLWTKELKQTVKFNNQDDGIFYMTVDEFAQEFDQFSIGYLRDNYVYNYNQIEVQKRINKYFKFDIDSNPIDVCFRIHQLYHKLGKLLNENYNYSPVSFQLLKQTNNTWDKVATRPLSENIANSSVILSDKIFQTLTQGSYMIYFSIDLPTEQTRAQVTISQLGTRAINLQKITQDEGDAILENFHLNLSKKKVTDQQNQLFMGLEFDSNECYSIYFENRNEKNSLQGEVFFTLNNMRLLTKSDKDENTFCFKLSPKQHTLAILQIIDLQKSFSYKIKMNNKLVQQ